MIRVMFYIVFAHHFLLLLHHELYKLVVYS